MALLHLCVRDGKPVAELPSLPETRKRATSALDRLPEAFHNIHHAVEARVELSTPLQEMMRKLERTL